MVRLRSDEDLRHLTHLLIDASDSSAEIALTCLYRGHDMNPGEEPVPADPTALSQSGEDPNQPTGRVRLKPVERDVVAWVAAGKSYADIATILALPYSTVRYHLDQARRRNGFHSVTQLVVRAACDFDMCPLQP